MVDINIKKTEKSIQDLDAMTIVIKKQMFALDDLSRKYVAIDSGQSDKKALMIILDELKVEYNLAKSLTNTLDEIVSCYKTTEKKILDENGGAKHKGRIQLVSLSNIKKNLDDLQIRFM